MSCRNATDTRLPRLPAWQLWSATMEFFVLAFAHAFARECSNFQFQSFAGQAVRSAELMQQPRRHGNTTLGIEADFTVSFRKAVATAAASGLAARLVQQLERAWQRLQRSGVLQTRSIRHPIEFLTEHQCKHPAHFKSCAACRAVVYCCREHQMAGWLAHKKACKAARKAAKAEGDEAGPSGA